MEESSGKWDAGYVVCNPATEQWTAVPCCDGRRPPASTSDSHTYLAFDPDVSSHFHLLLFWEDEEHGESLMTVHAYSSETTGAWTRS
ncbi:hypothetical protein BAE44_0015401 [Dichanthelium oligosanthes]|uniref:F-box associated domain-containing protein n=1 Tax=Dichanthelium oligosanthes TaxID=888268 RepID=A0A1E5VEL8_9POAL|nr:hypothetical protein BAE44_0015401 [Dichanthelium oligosanthes]